VNKAAPGPRRSRAAGKQLRDFRHSLPMELLKAREAAMARFRPMLRNHGLTEQQWRVVRALSEYDQIDASELAKRSFLLAPSLTRILQYLEGKGLILRTLDQNDQRKQVLALSRQGRRLFGQVAPDSVLIYAAIEQEFGVARLEALYALLADFYNTLDKISDQK
jgi:homoprotocatechuate degradation regulator HpaR